MDSGQDSIGVLPTRPVAGRTIGFRPFPIPTATLQIDTVNQPTAVLGFQSIADLTKDARLTVCQP